MSATIETEGLTKRYGQVLALDALDLELPQGAVLGFLGPNGCGKTTALRILVGFLRRTAGRARLLGRDCWREGPRIRRDVGYLPGDVRVWPRSTARSLLRLAGRVRGRALSRDGLALCERLALDPGLRAGRMSRGTRQKLGLVLALAHRPRVAVLDEPTAALDPVMQDRLRDVLLERVRDGATVLFSSHTLPEVERLCDRVVILREGRAVVRGRLEELRQSARREVRIVWPSDEAAPAAPPAGLELTAREGRVWSGALEGPAGPLLEWLAARRPEDVSIAPPDLEGLFRRYYGAGPAP